MAASQQSSNVANRPPGTWYDAPVAKPPGYGVPVMSPPGYGAPVMTPPGYGVPGTNLFGHGYGAPGKTSWVGGYGAPNNHHGQTECVVRPLLCGCALGRMTSAPLNTQVYVCAQPPEHECPISNLTRFCEEICSACFCFVLLRICRNPCKNHWGLVKV